ncbi:phosphatidate cytidylyltransferase [Tundrisphaera sp. TA3]|uniref:phosphatidate cytidylyltransferase n=1 Tax=Tundrisphaera sp. TA3 TaxID=3435775 RepID=UPI003EBE15A9
MLAHRLASGVTLVAILLAVLALDEWLAPWFPLWLATALVVMLRCGLEMVGLLEATEVRPSTPAVCGGLVAVIAANWAPHLVEWAGRAADPHLPATFNPTDRIEVLAWPFLAFVATLLATFLAMSVRFRGPGSTTATIAGTCFVVAYIGLLGSFMLQMRWFEGPYHGLIPLAALVATAKGTDIGAYTLGRILGRHKLWPVLSPNKTIEGGIGGLLFAVGGSLAVSAISRYLLHAPCLEWGPAIGFGLAIGVAAQLGDLMESMIKRDCERKDASSALPGFGGVLDVLDSLLFAAPVAYGYWIAFGP